MSAFPVDLVIKASLVLAAAALVDLVLRRRGSAAVRHFVLTTTVAALLVLPLASLVLPSWSIAVPIPAPAASAVSIAVDLAPAATSPAATSAAAVPLSASSTVPVPAQRTFDPLAFAFAIYSAGVLLLLARLAAEQVALSRVMRRAAVIADPAWLDLVSGAARQMGIARPVRLLQADDEVMPFTFGTRLPTIVLPAAAERWSSDRRRAVVVHELAHVARADCFAQRLAAFACALYWPHPGVWWVARRLRVEREHACDDRVLSMGTEPRDYADHLLEIAHAFRGTPAPVTALSMARARQLETRLLAVLDDARNRASLRQGGRVAAVAAAAALIVPMASLRAEVVRVQKNGPAARVHEASVETPWSGQDRGAFGAEDYSGTWGLRMSKKPGMAQVEFHTAHSNGSRSEPLSRFEGVNGAGMTAAVRDGLIVDGTVHFDNRRDAGTFTFDGVCKNQMCGGTFTFAPDPAFASKLAQYGVGRPTASEQYRLALEDVGVQYLEGLKAEGYAVPDVETLVRAAEHGVSLEYVKAMAALGYKLGTLEPLIKMRDHGVDPEYVRGMADAGFKSLTADQLARARDHGVDPQYVRGMRDLGLLASASLDDLIKTRDHGVDPAFVGDMSAAGYRGLSLSDLIRARDHGADPQFASGLAALGYRSLPLETLINARDHGVDPMYIGGLAQAGYKNLPLDALIRARDHGVDPAYVGGMAALGYKDLPIESLIRMRDHGVDPSYVRQLQQRGLQHLSVDDLIHMRDGGH